MNINTFNRFEIMTRALLFLVVFLMPAFPLFSQISLDGTVDKMDYVGSQPHLIQGVSYIPSAGSPLVRHVYIAGPDILVIVIDEKALVPSNLKPYRKQEEDVLVLGGYHGYNKFLVRKGDTLGYLAGRENNWHRPFNEVAGEALNLKWISNPDNFLISSSDDPKYKNGVHPLEVYRKSVPNEMITRLRVSPKQEATFQHYIYLKLPENLITGKHYKINFEHYSEGTFQKEVSFHFNDSALRSEAIQINLYGYEPKNKKIAFLSTWMGDGGALHYPDDLEFRVINLESNQTVFKGQVRSKKLVEEPEYVIDGKAYNHNNTDVYSMDFSTLQDQGKYKLVVDGIGSSFDFLIADNVWENTARLLMKGFLHQRAGIELGPPYTDYIRPRNLHPADGHTIHKIDPEKYSGHEGGRFDRIKAGIMEKTSVPEAWGGWMDAGDFDRRMIHFYSVRRMMYLYELNPDYYDHVDFGIPESSNSIPDILDEALWGIDIFRRTQGVYEEGAVSWQVESVEHPRHGETSWLNSLPTGILPPSVDAAANYIATAAHMAILLREFDNELAKKYRKSTMDALRWMERSSQKPDLFRLNLAYLNLYRLTGDDIWHQKFKETLRELYPKGIIGHLAYYQVEAVALYAFMDPSKVDKKLQEECITAIITFSDELIEGAEEVAYDILRVKNRPLSRLVPMPTKVLPVVVAHHLTRDDKYSDALTKTIQYTMGANPLNRSYISGLGERSFIPYHHDWHADNLPLPAGIPNFGPAILTDSLDLIHHPWIDPYQVPLENEIGLYPSKLEDWPLPEACFNQMWITPTNEFKVEIPMGELLLLTGYLASNKN